MARSLKLAAAVTAALALSVSVANANPVNGTGLVTPDVIFGSGNANGSFTGQTQNNIEVGLRGKQRYPAANIFNYDGVRTYTFDSNVLNTNPANRSVFNFEWTVNVNQDGTGTSVISDFDYLLSIDQNPGGGVNFAGAFDPINLPYADHAFGNNGTGNGGGTSAPFLDVATYAMLLGSSNVVQQSWNLGFGFSADPDLPGIYDFQLDVLSKGGSTVLSSANIQVIVEPVPVPAAIAPMLAGVAAFGFAAYRRRKQKAAA